MQNCLLWLASLLIISTFFSVEESSAVDAQPNVVLVMCDDMGCSDVSCYGGEINTSNIDRLAAEGLRFKQFYNCATYPEQCEGYDIIPVEGISLFPVLEGAKRVGHDTRWRKFNGNRAIRKHDWKLCWDKK